MKRYDSTGILSTTGQPSTRKPMFGDFTQQKDYQTSLDTVILAEEAFSELPAKTRRRFDDDPGKFLEFMGNKENFEEARKLNLIDVKPIEKNQQDILTEIAKNTKKEEKSVEKQPVQSEE